MKYGDSLGPGRYSHNTVRGHGIGNGGMHQSNSKVVTLIISFPPKFPCQAAPTFTIRGSQVSGH